MYKTKEQLKWKREGKELAGDKNKIQKETQQHLRKDRT